MLHRTNKTPRFRLQSVIFALVTLGLIIFALPHAVLALNQSTPPQQAEIQSLQPGDEVLDMRTRNSKTFYLGETPDGRPRYSLYALITPLHYQDIYGNWLEIDNQFTLADPPWDWEMTDAGYNVKVLQNFDSGQILQFGKQGETVAFQPMALEWTNNLEQIQPIAMPHDVEGQVQNPTVELILGQILHHGKIFWWDAYGPGIDFEWQCTNSRLQKVLTVSGLSDLPPPEQYIIDGGNPVLRFNLIFDPSSNLEIYVDDTLWDKKSKVQTFDDIIEFKKDDETLWGFMPLLYWDSSDNESQQSIATLEKRGNKLYTYITIPYEWLQSAAFPIYIDTDVDEQVGASADDANEKDDGTGFSSTSDYFTPTADADASIRANSGARFQTVNIPNAATISTAYFSIWFYSTSYDSIAIDIYLNDVDDANDFSTEADVTSRALTSASTSWQQDNCGASDFVDSPSIVNAVQEVINRASWSANNDMCIIARGKSGIGTRNTYAWAYDGDTAKALKLHIEYSAGVTAPTVTSDNASNIEEYTALLSGNVTATGGANVTSRGFEWGTSSGNYTANVTEAGDWESGGTFSGNATSLSAGTQYFWRAMAMNSEGWGYGSELTFYTKPLAPSNLGDTGRTDTTIDLEWTKHATANQTLIRYRTDQYPTGTGDGTQGYLGTANTSTVTSLSSGQIYYFRAWSQISDQYSDNTSDDTAYTLPGNPANMASSNVTSSSFDIEWTKGTGGDKTHVRYKTVSYPADVTDGTQAYFDTANITTITSLLANTEYFVRGWAYDSDSTYYSANYTQTTETTSANITAPTVVTDNASSVDCTSATLNGNITSTGGENPDERGFEWGTSSGNYTDNWTEAGSFGTGTYSHSSSNLSTGTTYYYRAMAHNSANWSYGSEVSFNTTAISLAVQTDAATGIGCTTVTLNGQITSLSCENATSRGFRWGTSSGNYTDNWTEGGSFGTGSFNHSPTLSVGITYYYQAMAENSHGWTYGAEENFSTTAISAPTVTTSAATGVTDNVSTLNGNITSVNCENADERGFDWGTASGNYTDNWTEAGSFSTGAFNRQITGLLSNTTYYFRSKAHNSAGWGHGSELSFTTTAPTEELTTLTLIAILDNQINASWDAVDNATGYLLLVSMDDYPSDPEGDDVIAHSGNQTITSVNLTGYNLLLTTYYFSLWAETNSYSEQYATASIGGESMEALVAAITAGVTEFTGTLTTITTNLTSLLIPIILTAFAYWHRDRLMYLLAGLVFLLYGFTYWSTSEITSIALVVSGIFVCIKAGIKQQRRQET